MNDYIKGPVVEVIDENTILVAVEYVGTDNKKEYQDIERIQIKALEPPFLKKIKEDEKKLPRLKKKLLNQTVYCYIQGTNKKNEYLSRVVCDGPKFRGKRNRV